jgi:hypothetical protein
MKNRIAAVAAIGAALALPGQAQDMAVMQKWATAKTVKYRVEGVHNARARVVMGDHEGKADVLDRVVVEFAWDVQKRRIIEPVTVTDGKSEVKNMKSDGTNCPPPQLKGDYEHFVSGSHKLISPEQLQLSGSRTYPAASVSNYPASCSMRGIGGGKEQVTLFMAAVGPETLGMPIMKGPVTIAPDRKSFSIKGADNWVWTYTPTLAQ